MKAGLIRLVVAGMMVAGVSVMAAVDNTAAPKHARRTEWKGVVSVPATNAVDSALAVLTVKHGDASKAFNLTATDADVIATIKADAAKGATVIVHGELSKDETAIAVTKCVEAKKSSDKPAAGSPNQM